MKAIFATLLVSAVASAPALAKPRVASAPPAPAPPATVQAVADVPPPPPVIAPAARVLPTDATISAAAHGLVAPASTAPAAALPAPAPASTGDDVTKLDLGSSYGLKSRTTALPDIEIESFEAKSLSENQVGDIVRERAEDLEYCWLRLPPKKRVVSAAILHLEIEQSGKVATVEVNGDLPAGVGTCITQLAGRWTFPAADAPSTVDHGIMLTTTSQKVR